MDLSTIRMKLSPAHFEHYVDVEGFCDDMRLVFQNCFIFNTVSYFLSKIITSKHYFPTYFIRN